MCDAAVAAGALADCVQWVEQAFLEALPAQAVNAYADQCAPANPRMPMIDDMQRLMRQAYYGNAEGAPGA